MAAVITATGRRAWHNQPQDGIAPSRAWSGSIGMTSKSGNASTGNVFICRCSRGGRIVADSRQFARLPELAQDAGFTRKASR